MFEIQILLYFFYCAISIILKPIYHIVISRDTCSTGTCQLCVLCYWLIYFYTVQCDDTWTRFQSRDLTPMGVIAFTRIRTSYCVTSPVVLRYDIIFQYWDLQYTFNRLRKKIEMWIQVISFIKNLFILYNL